MARSIGSIEISVDLNTKRLMATAIKAGEEVGKATRKEIESELSKIRANIAKIDGRKEAQLLRAQIEEAVRDIDATLDFTQARAALKQFEENAEAVRLVLNVGAELSETDLQQIRVDFKGYKERIEADKIRARLELDAEDVYDKAAAAQVALDNLGFTWTAELTGIDEAVEEANTAKFAIEKNRIQLQVTAAASLVTEVARIEAAKEAIERDAVRWNIDFATAIGKGETEMRLFLAKERNIKLGMDTDVAAVAAQLEVDLLSIEEALPTVDYELEARHNEAHLATQLATINAMAEAGIRDFNVNVEVGVDMASKAKTDALMKANMRETGKQSGDQFSQGMGGSMLSGDNTKLLIAAVATMGDSLAAGLEGALAAATAVISSAFYAVGSAAVTAAPLIAGFAGALGAVVVGSQGVGTALSEISNEFAKARSEGRDVDLTVGKVGEAMRNLSPAAHDAATAFAGIKDELRTLRLDVQNELFSGMADTITKLGRTALPSIAKGLEVSADSVNHFGQELGDLASKTDFEGIFKALDPALDDMFDAIKAAFGSLEPFLKKASPAAERLAEMIERGAEAFEAWVSTDPDQLATFLDDGLDSLEAWVELLGSTGDLLGTIFAAGKESGDNFVISLNNMIERWDAFLEGVEGQEALTGFFERGEDAMRALEPLLDGLKEAFDILIDNDTMSNFEALSSAIGDMLPELGQMLAVLGDLQLVEALTPIVDIIGGMAQALGLLPDGILEVVGTLLVMAKTAKTVFTAVKGVEVGIKALDAAIMGMSRTNIILTGIAIAAVGLVTIFGKLGDKSQDTARKTKELTAALQDNVDAIIASGDVAAGTSFGFKTLNETLLETEGSGDKISAAFKTINSGSGKLLLTVDDITRILQRFKGTSEEAEAALVDLAQGYGLPGPVAAELSEIVNSTNDNFEDAQVVGTSLGDQLQVLADKAGKPKDEIVLLARAMETLQDQGRDTDLEGAAQGLLDIEVAGSAAEKAILAEVQAAADSGKIHNDALTIYDEYTRRLNEEANATDDVTTALDRQKGSYALIQESIEAGIAAMDERNAKLKEERDKAYDAWQAEEKLADKTEDVAAAAADAMGFSEGLADEVVELGKAARQAADDADALRESFDLLIGPGVDVEKAFLAVNATILDYQEVLEEGTTGAVLKRAEAETKLADAVKEGTTPERAEQLRLEAAALVEEAEAAELGVTSMDKRSEAGQRNIGIMLDYAAGIVDTITAMTAEGKSTEEIIATQQMMREGLIQTADQFGRSREEAEVYVDTLLGTPEFMETLISTPGLLDALLNAEDLTLLYNEVGEGVVTEFVAMGLPESLAQSTEFHDMLVNLGLITAEPTVDPAGTEEAAQLAQDTGAYYDELGVKVVQPTVTEPTPEAQDAVTTLTTDIETLDGKNATPTITIHNLATTLLNVEKLVDEMGLIKNKTVTVTVNYKATGTPPPTAPTSTPRPGERPTGGSMAGEMINFPTIRRVGERGYREAIIPLQLPLNRVNPEVRELAALLRGGGTTLPGRVVNNNINQTITPLGSDPEAVATSVVNRIVAGIRR